MIVTTRPAWRWVVTAYFAQGVPFAIVMSAAATALKDLKYPDSRITPVIGAASLAWSLKPVFAGFLELLRPLRFWVLSTELAMALLMVLGSLVMQLRDPFWPLCGVFVLLAFSSATQDIAIDGTFITELGEKQQSAWAGFCGAAWNGGRLFAAAAMVGLASVLQQRWQWRAPAAWATSFLLAAACLLLLSGYHQRVLPRSRPLSAHSAQGIWREVLDQWGDLLAKPGLLRMFIFVALYRVSEGFLLLEVPLFLQSSTADQGLGLCATVQTTPDCPHLLQDRALLDGLLGTLVSATFGILGGKYLAHGGLTRRSLLFMACCLNLPHVTILLLSQIAALQGSVGFATIAGLVLLEKAGYSFGFVANMVYIMQRLAPGRYPTAHYAFATAVMHLVLIPTQALSGPLAAWLGYPAYFAFACVAAVPSLWAAYQAPLPEGTDTFTK